mgnify:CR=1 FL=1
MFRLVTDEETYEQGTWSDVEKVLHQIVADERVFFSLFWDSPKENCHFVQAIMDEDHPDQLNLEIALDIEGYNHMYVKRYVTTKWCIETLQSMDRESRIPDVTNWEFVGAFPQG